MMTDAAGPGERDDAVDASGTPPLFRPSVPASIEAPSPDVAPVAAEQGMPGAHRGGFSRLPTAPVGVPVAVSPDDSAPPAGGIGEAPSTPYRGIAGWALAFGVAGLVFSLFVGWAFPMGLVAIGAAIVALRRPIESRATAVWALCLGAVSVLYSAGWLLWAATRASLFG